MWEKNLLITVVGAPLLLSWWEGLTLAVGEVPIACTDCSFTLLSGLDVILGVDLVALSANRACCAFGSVGIGSYNARHRICACGQSLLHKKYVKIKKCKLNKTRSQWGEGIFLTLLCTAQSDIEMHEKTLMLQSMVRKIWWAIDRSCIKKIYKCYKALMLQKW